MTTPTSQASTPAPAASTNYTVGDFVWAKMTGYPYWPGKVVEPDVAVKKPKGKSEFFYVRFYGTGDHAYIKVENMENFDAKKEELVTSSKRVNFLEAVKEIEHAFERRSKGLPDTSEESSESDASDDQPLAKKSKGSKQGSKSNTPRRKRKSVTKKHPTREQLTLHHHDLSHYLLTRSLETNSPERFSNTSTSRSPAGVHVSSRPSPDSTAAADSTTQVIPKNIIPTDKKIGFLGLGIMGSAMAMNLVKSGHHITVWNRSKGKCTVLASAGATVAATPADVVQVSDITFSCVSDANSVRDIVVGNSGVLQGISAGKGFVDMSTVDPATVAEIAEAITMRGGRYLEAPVSGSKKPAENGQLLILAAGDRSLYMDCYSSFEAMGKKTFFLGELGTASRMKLVVNMMLGSFMASLSEGFSLAEQAGVDQYTLLEILESSAMSCPLVKSKGSAILEGHFPANFPLKHQQKDLRLALQMAEELEQPLHVAGATNELFKRAKAMGYGDRDMSCVYRAINA